jgi:hypothetical protein
MKAKKALLKPAKPKAKPKPKLVPKAKPKPKLVPKPDPAAVIAATRAALLTELEAAQNALWPAVERLAKAMGAYDTECQPIGATADLLYDLRAIISAVNHMTDPVEELLQPAAKNLEEYFVNKLNVGEASGVQGMRSRVQISSSNVPVADDWDTFYAHLRRTGEFELLNKALNREAVRERWDAGDQVPGVGKIITKKVSCTALRGK